MMLIAGMQRFEDLAMGFHRFASPMIKRDSVIGCMTFTIGHALVI